MIIGTALTRYVHYRLPILSINRYFGARVPPTTCMNSTIAQSYLAQTLSLLNTLQRNSLYNSVLQVEMGNFVSYLRNATNQALLRRNCSAFINGLKAAKSADRAAKRTRRRIAFDIQRQLRMITRNATGSYRPYGLYFRRRRRHF